MAWKPDPTIDPQSPQRNENPRAYKAYVAYRELLEQSRSVALVAQHLNEPFTSARRWSKGFGWTKRAKLWDEQVNRSVNARTLDAASKVPDRHLTLAREMQLIALSEVRAIMRRIQWAERREAIAIQANPDTPPRKPLLKPHDVVRIGQVGVMLERLHIGAPTGNVEHKVDLSAATVEELRQLEALLAKVERGVEPGPPKLELVNDAG